MSWPAACASGPVLPPTGHAPVHQPRVASQALLGAQAEPLGDARPEPFDQRVGLLHQTQHGLDPVRVLEVDRDCTAAARVEREAARTRGPLDHLDPLDPHDVRSHVGQQRCREGARPDAGDLDDPHPVQWSHTCFPSFDDDADRTMPPARAGHRLPSCR